MTLMVTKRTSRLTPVAESEAAPVDILFYASGECELGQVLIARSTKGVCAILLGDDHLQLANDLARRFPKATLVANKAMVQQDLAKVTCFVAKPAEGLDLELDMRGTPIQRRVWEKLRAIPLGRTVTYSELARWLAAPTAARAIGAACAANPIALAIPCHRVIRSDGGLAGYRWGIHRKRELLNKEAAA
jgi:methylated-DNA-[protein]-cysteine S-methyltransferase/AraC family transcriptional regulator of adaptative response/methylated-DNA-[protein]-cysteine methyltransferase